MRLPLRSVVLVVAVLATPLTASGLAQAEAHRVHHTVHRAAPPPLLRAAVADLAVTAESREGYKRTSFKHWVDADGDGCTARYEVLKAEAIDPPQVGPECALTGGAWYSYYDDVVVEAASGLDVDHVISVPATQM